MSIDTVAGDRHRTGGWLIFFVACLIFAPATDAVPNGADTLARLDYITIPDKGILEFRYFVT
jgi:hypothetical protein